jgi:hypothetical protein
MTLMKRHRLLAILAATLLGAGAAHAGEWDCIPPRPAPTTFLGRLCDRLERHSCGYGKTHHDLGCTGCRADAIFVFGSCWQFFEEPCRRQSSWKK